jgi:hypothetical protein
MFTFAINIMKEVSMDSPRVTNKPNYVNVEIFIQMQWNLSAIHLSIDKLLCAAKWLKSQLLSKTNRNMKSRFSMFSGGHLTV